MGKPKEERIGDQSTTIAEKNASSGKKRSEAVSRDAPRSWLVIRLK
jgi:hypothetical protein